MGFTVAWPISTKSHHNVHGYNTTYLHGLNLTLFLILAMNSYSAAIYGYSMVNSQSDLHVRMVIKQDPFFDEWTMIRTPAVTFQRISTLKTNTVLSSSFDMHHLSFDS